MQRLRPGALGGDGRGGRPRGRPRTSRSATPTPPAWSPTSRRCWRVEAARSGQATGEVTSGAAHAARRARRRLPWRMRHPRAGSPRWRCWRVIVALVLVLAAGQHPPRHRRRAGRPRRTRAWNRSPLGQTAAHDYNPFGTGPENRDQIGNVVDSDPNTTWSTEQYYDGTPQEARRRRHWALPRRRPPASRRGRSRSRRRRPASRVQIYVAEPHRPEASLRQLDAAGRARLAGPGGLERLRAQRRTDPAARWAGTAYRYYLVWMTTLPPGHAVGDDRRSDAVQMRRRRSSSR